MSPHAFINTPPLAQQRTLFIRTRRPWWQRLGGVLTLLAALVLLASGAALAIARMHASEAQLQAAHAAGLAAGMGTCPGR